MNEDFAYIVTPAAFDVKVVVGPQAPFEVDTVYGTIADRRIQSHKPLTPRSGSPGHAPNHDGVLCEINSVFPSAKESPELTKGGVVTIKLRATDNASKEPVLPLVYAPPFVSLITDRVGSTKYFDPRGNAVRFTSEARFAADEEYWGVRLLCVCVGVCVRACMCVCVCVFINSEFRINASARRCF